MSGKDNNLVSVMQKENFVLKIHSLHYSLLIKNHLPPVENKNYLGTLDVCLPNISPPFKNKNWQELWI